MKKAEGYSDINELINNNPMTILYFNGSTCGACEVIKNKIENILMNFPNIESREINGERDIKLATYYSVFSLPVFLLFIEGKEFLRVGRNVNLLELEKDIRRYYEMIFD